MQKSSFFRLCLSIFRDLPILVRILFNWRGSIHPTTITLQIVFLIVFFQENREESDVSLKLQQKINDLTRKSVKNEEKNMGRDSEK